MGTWGHGIFDSDMAADLRSELRDAIAAGGAPREVTTRLIAAWRDTLEDPEDGPTAWLALAEAQRECGRLDDRVKRRAIEVLEAGGDLARWEREAPELAKKRERVLKKLRTQLDAPLPAAKKIRPRARYETALEVGDLLAYRLASAVAEAWIALWVRAITEYPSGRAPVVVPLARGFATAPTPADCANVEACWRRDRDPTFGGKWCDARVSGMQHVDHPGRRYHRIAQKVTPLGEGKPGGGTVCFFGAERTDELLRDTIVVFRCTTNCARCGASGYPGELPDRLDGLLPTAFVRTYRQPIALDAKGRCDNCR